MRGDFLILYPDLESYSLKYNQIRERGDSNEFVTYSPTYRGVGLLAQVW